jgi:haloalkane dehalogenase
MTEHPWLLRAEYTFESRYLAVDGGSMHYVDEGNGRPVVFVHGTPTWSFMYRKLIRRLSPHVRCVAPDNLGFGLSARPRGWGGRPEDHARNLHALIEQLGLRDLTLVVHDFGGPIGLAYALDHPENVRSLVLFNTWMWSLADTPSVARGARLLGGPLGKLLFTRTNFDTRVLLPALWADKATLTPEIHRQYRAPLATPSDRLGIWALARELLGSSRWFDALWERRERLRDKPALLLWGPEDRIFGGQLGRWQELFPDAETHTFSGAGHFVPEERAEEVGPLVEAFVRSGAHPAPKVR